MAEYRQKQLWKLYEKLPEELKEAIFSEETADNIYDVCTREGIEDDRISEIARYTGWVLLGLLVPDEFQKTLEEKVKLKEGVAEKIASGINRFVFRLVKESLSSLYKIEIVPPSEAVERLEPLKPGTAIKEPPKKDIYREPIE